MPRVLRLALFAGLWLPSAAIAQPFQPVLRVLPQQTVLATPVASVVVTPRTTVWEPAYTTPRTYLPVDLNADGLQDLVVAPSHVQTLPTRPIELWLNQGDGSFRNATRELVAGAVPHTWLTNDLLVGDFNEDGQPDLVFVNTGAENAVGDGAAQSGYPVVLLLSRADRRWEDASSNLPGNEAGFHHSGSVGDFDGDGHLDLAIFRGGTTAHPLRNGVLLFKGDGKGGFSALTHQLPPEIRYMEWLDRPAGADYQNVGCVALVDVDGQGRAALITGTYRSDWPVFAASANGRRTLRFHRPNAQGRWTEYHRLEIPAAIASVPYDPHAPPQAVVRDGLGCYQVVGGDLDGDGRRDLVVLWEGAGQFFVELLRNEGGGRFTDITLQAVGTYDLGTRDRNGASAGPSRLRLFDANGDGASDLVLDSVMGPVDSLLPRLALLNDGKARFTPWVPWSTTGQALTTAEVQAVVRCPDCLLLPLVFDTQGQGVASIVLLDWQTRVNTSAPTVANPLQPTAVTLTTLQPTTGASWLREIDCLLDWGERSYPTLLSPAGTPSRHAAPYRYRYYAGSDSYVGASAADGHLVLLGADRVPTDLGDASSWLRQAGCTKAALHTPVQRRAIGQRPRETLRQHKGMALSR